MKQFAKLLFVVMMCVAVQQVWAQTSFTAKIYVTDGVGLDTLTMGFDSTATKGFDPDFGDIELPPPPPAGVFYTCFKSPDTTFYGQGKRIDYRKAITDIQSDTFVVYFQKSNEASNITLSWDENIGDAGPGDIRWEIRDVITGNLIYVIMNNQTSITINPNIYSQVKIIRRDGAHFRTLTMDEWATAVDAKGKSKGVKQKPVASHFIFTMTNTTGQPATKLVVKFGAVVTDLVSFSPFTSAEGEGSKEITFTGVTLNPNQSVTIEGYGDKGKPMKVKGTFYNSADVKLKPAPTATFTLNQPLLPMPNAINVGEELYAQGTSITLGLASSVRSVIHPKFKDVMKTFNSKGQMHTGAAKCFDMLGAKEWKKQQKSLPAAKHDNELAAEQLALKLNIALGDKGKVDATYPFGDLIYMGSYTALQGKTIREIANQIDSVLSCVNTDTTAVKDLSLTFDDWFNIASLLNGAFSDEFDTVSWAGKLVLTAPVSIADGPFAYLVRNPNLQPVTSPAPRPVVETYVPETFELLQNYPNPFNPTTTIEFTLPYDAAVTIAVYNMLGQKVATLADREEFTEGANDVEFDASELASGVYFYRISVNDLQSGKQMFSSVKKMMLVK